MPAQQEINVLEPSVWNNMPANTRVSAMVEVQSRLVRAAVEPYWTDLLKLQNDGKIGSATLVVVQRDEKCIPVPDRRKMGEAKYWTKLLVEGDRNTYWKTLRKHLDAISKSVTAARKKRGDLTRIDYWRMLNKDREAGLPMCVVLSNGMAFVAVLPFDEIVQEKAEESSGKVFESNVAVEAELTPKAE